MSCLYLKPLGDQTMMEHMGCTQVAKMTSVLVYGFHYQWMLMLAAGRVCKLTAFGVHRTVRAWCLPEAHTGHIGWKEDSSAG
jgi:hypothetical protein